MQTEQQHHQSNATQKIKIFNTKTQTAKNKKKRATDIKIGS